MAWDASHRVTLIVVSLLEVIVAIIIAMGIGGGWTEWEGKDVEGSNTGGADFGPCLVPSCAEESENSPERKPPRPLEKIFGIPLLLSPAILGAAPAIVRSFLKRIDLIWSIGYSMASIVLSSMLYLVIGALLLIGVVRYVLDPSLFPEIILFPLALAPLPWIVDRLIKAALGG